MKAKKIVSLLLAAAMTVSMAACGGSNQTSASKNNSNNSCEGYSESHIFGAWRSHDGFFFDLCSWMHT